MLETVAANKGAELLFSLTILGFLSLATAGLAMFLQECMEREMILRRYYLLLIYHWRNNWRKKDRWKRAILKPLGLCVYCNSVYLGSIFLFSLTNLYFYLPLFLGFQFLWLIIFTKIKAHQ
jgi:hypothetical protein